MLLHFPGTTTACCVGDVIPLALPGTQKFEIYLFVGK